MVGLKLRGAKPVSGKAKRLSARRRVHRIRTARRLVKFHWRGGLLVGLRHALCKMEHHAPGIGVVVQALQQVRDGHVSNRVCRPYARPSSVPSSSFLHLLVVVHQQRGDTHFGPAHRHLVRLLVVLLAERQLRLEGFERQRVFQVQFAQ
jgi:hypothetical protein